MTTGQMSSLAMAAVSLADEVFGVARVEANPGVIRAQIGDGLPYAAADAVQAAYGISQSDLAALLGLGTKTLGRVKRQGGRLGTKASDRLARLVRVFDQTCVVLGERNRACRWLATANAALGGAVPRQWLDTDVGTQEVTQLLGRIEHGVFS